MLTAAEDRQRLADAVKHIRMNQSVAPDQAECTSAFPSFPTLQS